MHAESKALLAIARRLADHGLLAGTSGNLSVRLDDGRILATPTRMYKGTLTADDLVLLDRSGELVRPDGPKPSSEIAVHLALYKASSDIGAVVHAHPAHATVVGMLDEPVNLCITAEGAAAFGPAARIMYIRPGTEHLATACASAWPRAACILMRHHGATTVGEDLEEAWARMSSLEHVCRIWVLARQAGLEPPVLSDDEVRALRVKMGWPQDTPVGVFDL
ncbi:MAG: class II aldolase/adducin family protein [Myxococcota bacterium]